MRTLILLLVTVLGIGILAGAYIVTTGVSARTQPSQIEALTARTVRGMAIRFRVGGLTDPVSVTDATIAEGMEHFADHCASCHGNDGGGDTEMGRGLYPRAPDMRLPATQNLSDAELFYIIENGVRLTGMPGWSTGTKDGETSSWHLVHFIRHLPKLTEEELEHMASLNPKSPAEVRQDIEAEKFLQGGDAAPPEPDTHAHTGAHP
ncbi:MAG TPA: c-type cytochrome [Vicinamibacterales bacterium]|nr:c-type cytochrome [Vicinamibacterales bacterium]